METSNFNPSDSIKTIEDALKQVKSEKTGASYYYVVWGTLLLIHYLLLFFVTRFPDLKGNFIETIIWGVFPLGGLLSFLRGKKDSKNEKMLSLHEKVYLYTFGGFALCYGTVFIASAITEPSFLIAIYPLLLGFTVFVVGGITKHKPSLICGVLSILCTGISLNVSLELQYLLAALASLISCIIPGFLMKNSNV